MASNPEKRALLIAGPTASGKSALAMQMARERNGIIINADALQVYRELRILTARPRPAEEAAVPHRLYGEVSGCENYSVAHWLDAAAGELNAAWEAGLLPIVTGGTGLYFKALEQGLADVPPIAMEVRQHWRNYAGNLHAALAERDRAMATRLNPADRQRIIRALEVIEGTCLSLAHWQELGKAHSVLRDASVERILVDVGREELQARAEARFDAMIAAGAVEEVRPLLGLDSSLPMMKAIGVPELSAHLRGECPLDEATARAKAATRQYIKRQITWWRGQGRGWNARVVP